MKSKLTKKIEKYFSLKSEIRDAINEFDFKDIDKNDKVILYELMKENNFEAKVFEILLKADSIIAYNYLIKYYLEGEPENKTKFKGNLTVMLDDYKEIMGEQKFKELISNLPDSTLKFPPIKEAIEFVEDS